MGNRKRKVSSTSKAATNTGEDGNGKVKKIKTSQRDSKLASLTSTLVAAAVASTSKTSNSCPLEKRNFNRTEHPLANPVILDNLFRYLTLLDHQKQIRQVCKLWKKINVKHWRALATVRLGPPVNNKLIIDNTAAQPLPPSTQNSNFWPIDEYWQQLGNPADDNELVDKPFRKYIFTELNIRTCWVLQPILDDAEEENSFWNAIRDQVISLTFERCTFPGDQPEYFEKIVTERLPNLETLSLIDNITSPKGSFYEGLDKRIVDISPDNCQQFKANMKLSENLKSIKIEGETPMCFHMMLLNAPNIERFHLDTKLLVQGSLPFLWFQRLCCQRSKLFSTRFSLKHLDLMGYHFFNAWFDITRHLRMYRFPLEFLSVTISNNGIEFDDERDDDVTNNLIPLVRYGAEKLKILKIFRPPVYTVSNNNPFPVCMVSLKELYLYGNVVDNLDFLQNMKSLEVLHMDYDCFDKVRLMYNLFIKDPTKGHEIKLFRESCLHNMSKYDHKLITAANSREYGRMKQLKKCHLNVSFDQNWPSTLWKTGSPIEVLVEWMPNLTTLEINLTTKEFRVVCKHLPNLEQLVLLYKSEIDDAAVTGLETGKKKRCSENLTSFKKLKTFQLRQLCWPTERKSNNRLSNASVYQGFLKMNSLNTVIICVSPEMTVVAETALHQHVPNVQVIRNYDNENVHGDGECCTIKYTQLELSGCLDK